MVEIVSLSIIPIHISSKTLFPLFTFEYCLD